MKKTLLRLTAICCFVIAVIALNSNSGGGFSTDLTGSPLSGATCQNGCHSSFPLNSGSGSVNMTIPASYYPGTTYNISMSVSQSSPAASRYGFMAGVLRDDNTNGGTFTAGTGSSATTISGRSYIRHNSLLNSSGTWSFSWTAPAYADTINFYYAGNAANFNGTNQGDYIYTGSSQILPIDLITFEIDTTDISCFSVCDGGLTVANVSGGEGGPYTFEWSNSATTASISSLCAGTYTVTVTDNNGNEEVESITLSQPTDINANMMIMPSTCATGDGQIGVSPSGGTPGYTYLWNTNSTDSVILNASLGMYTVTITDAAGCTKVESGEVTASGSGLVGLFDVSPENCDQQNGGLNLTMLIGNAPYTYAWNVAGSGNSISGLTAGAYTVTVTDNLGCIEVFTETVSETQSVIDLGLSEVNPVVCPGIPSGSINVVMAEGIAPFDYNWSNSGTGASIINLLKGTYAVTVTDSAGCVDTASFVVTEPDSIIADVSATPDNDGTCDGSLTVSASGGTGTLGYTWSHDAGLSDSVATGLCAGTYTISVTDDNGCNLTINTEVDAISVVAEFGSRQLAVYPNPGDGLIQITGDIQPGSEIWLMDITGRVIAKARIDESNTIDLRHVEPGRYELLVYDNAQFVRKSLVISR